MAREDSTKDLDKLKRKRTTIRSISTKLMNKISDIISETEIDFAALEDAQEQLKSKETEIIKLDGQIEDLVEDLDQLELEILNSQEYLDKIILSKSQINRTLRNSQTSNVKSIYKKTESVSRSNSSEILEPKLQLKLPKLVIDKFDGNLEHWQEFWSQFETSIHENNTLSKTQKFVYLKSLLKGSALVAVQGLLVSDANYDTALSVLKDRYGRKDVLIRSHLNALLNLSPAKGANNLKELRHIFDICEIQIRSLVSLGIKLETYGNLLYPIITKLIPENLMLDYNRVNTKEEDSWDVSKLLEFLKDEIVNREKTFLFRNETKSENVFRSNVKDQNFVSKSVNQNFGFRNNCFQKKTDKPSLCVPTGAELFSSSENRDFNKVNCVFCDKSHFSSDCKNVNNLSLDEKRSLLMKKGVCFKCLRFSHVARFCKSKVKCSICGYQHYSIMCRSQDNNVLFDKSEGKNENVLANQACEANVILQTLNVRIYNGKKEFCVRGLIDTGSQKSYASQEIIKRLGYKPTGEIKMMHTLFGGIQTQEEIHNKYLINVSSEDKHFKCSFEVLDQIKICNDLAKIPHGIWIEELKRVNVRLNDVTKSTSIKRSKIHLLIGADIAGKLLTGNIYACPSGPVAVETKLGWTLMGKIPSGPVADNNALIVTSLLLTEKLDNFWKLDVIGITDPAEKKMKSELHEETMQYFLKTVRREENGRYEVALPWVKQPEHLPSNRAISEKRAISVKNQLIKIDKFKKYSEIFEDWLREGIIERVSDLKEDGAHYLPHRPVIKESSLTTKIRPVFDASASKRGKLSLNDCLESGPNLLEMIPSLLNKFRKNRFGVSSDIEKAFLQLSIRKEDRDYLRFIWYDIDGKELVYRHRRVVFGVSSSPFLLNATLSHHFNETPPHFKSTAEIMKESFYVDNLVTSLNSVPEVEKLVVESQILLSSAQFNLRGWRSNASTPIFENFDEKKVLVLGLLWDVVEDTLSCNYIEKQMPHNITKRVLLSILHSIFDPLGFTCPVTLIPKILLQETWILKLPWDQEIPKELMERFTKWMKKLMYLSFLKIPRWIGLLPDYLENATIHIFCDASKHAYAACIFLRIVMKNRISVQLIQAKTRVAPLKIVSIPRLELMACLIGARLASNLIEDLKFHSLKKYYWSDSINTLCWIRRNENWATFVQNRVEEIRKLSNIEDWNHITGTENPADLPSRGCTAEALYHSKWWEGPLWLQRPETEWPISEALPNLEIVNSEKKKSVISAVNIQDTEEKIYDRYSSYNRLIRIITWIYRFFSNAKKKPEERVKEGITVSEINAAELVLLKLVQIESFSGIQDKRIQRLQLLIDSSGLIRLKTRILKRKDTEDFRFPILLPSDHPVVSKLIIAKHKLMSHAGVQFLISALREKFWILKARKTIRRIIRKCVQCQKFDSNPVQTPLAPLPEDRVREASVFEIVGVDLTGPLILKEDQKSWIVIFTCAVFRAVHLELVSSLSTESFLQALRRFISRRGRPHTIYSDNGTNFTGSDRLFRNIDWSKISDQATIYRISWKFIPPSAPWWGGWWERLIGVLKRILRKVLGRTSLNHEEMITVLCDIEAIMNNRPLTYISEDAEDLVPITPSMFLQDVHEIGVPDLDNLNTSSLNKRFRYRQRVMNDLRKRFRSEYLGQLRHSSKYIKLQKPVEIGDIVIVSSDNTKRIDWPLARVIEVYPSKDGHVRLVKLKMKSGEYLRPIKRLLTLEVQRDTDSSETEINVPDKINNDPSTSAETIRRSRYGRILKHRL